MDKGLDSEKPDLVVVNGDLITSGCASALEMKQPMNNVARSMAASRAVGDHLR